MLLEKNPGVSPPLGVFWAGSVSLAINAVFHIAWFSFTCCTGGHTVAPEGRSCSLERESLRSLLSLSDPIVIRPLFGPLVLLFFLWLRQHVAEFPFAGLIALPANQKLSGFPQAFWPHSGN